MKRIILLTIICACTLFKMQAQVFPESDATYLSENINQSYQKMVDSTNRWNYLEEAFITSGEGEAKTYSLFITTDTIIAGKTYKKVMCQIIRQNSNDIVYAASIREDNDSQTVFIKFEDIEEKIIYSFNHKVGDIISVDTTFHRDAYNVRSIKSIGTFDFNGTQRKKIEIADTLYRINHPRPDLFPPQEVYTDFWYEGIGSFKSFFNLILDASSGSFYGEELLCFWNEDTQIYQNPDWNTCEYAIIVTEIKEISNFSDFKVFPNPTNGEFQIKSDEEIENITITDLNGNIILNLNNKSDIDISEQPNGIYILKIKTKNQKYSEKIVKTK